MVSNNNFDNGLIYSILSQKIHSDLKKRHSVLNNHTHDLKPRPIYWSEIFKYLSFKYALKRNEVREIVKSVSLSYPDMTICPKGVQFTTASNPVGVVVGGVDSDRIG